MMMMIIMMHAREVVTLPNGLHQARTGSFYPKTVIKIKLIQYELFNLLFIY